MKGLPLGTTLLFIWVCLDISQIIFREYIFLRFSPKSNACACAHVVARMHYRVRFNSDVRVFDLLFRLPHILYVVEFILLFIATEHWTRCFFLTACFSSWSNGLFSWSWVFLHSLSLWSMHRCTVFLIFFFPKGYFLSCNFGIAMLAHYKWSRIAYLQELPDRWMTDLGAPVKRKAAKPKRYRWTSLNISTTEEAILVQIEISAIPTLPTFCELPFSEDLWEERERKRERGYSLSNCRRW